MSSSAHDIVEMITSRIDYARGPLEMSEPLDAIGLDSMEVVSLTFDIEEKFNVTIPFNANTDIHNKTVGDLIQMVDELVAAKASAGTASA
jgi:acyl carrier protein